MEERPTFRVQASINSAYPDLYDELAKMPTSTRADRMRFLASIGLMAMSGRLSLMGHSGAEAANVRKEPVSDDGARHEPEADRTAQLAMQTGNLLSGL